MRVLAVSDFYLPRAGGVERVVGECARRLVTQGVEVEVLTRRLDRGQPARQTLDGVTVWRVGAGPGPLPLELVRTELAVAEWADLHLERFDLIHAHLSLVAGGLARRVRIGGPPLVVTFYGPWHEEYCIEMAEPATPSRWPRVLRRVAVRPVATLLYRLQGQVLRAAREHVVLSEHSARELARDYPRIVRPVNRVPGGVDCRRFRLRDRAEARARLGLDGAPLVVTVRRLVPRMGLAVLLQAIAELIREAPGATLAVAGVGPLRDSLGQMAGSLGLGDRVRFLGRVEEEHLPWLYAAADVVALPTAALEGFGLPVLEAWAAGRAVVSTPVGALPETVSRLDPRFVARDNGSTALCRALAEAVAAEDVTERARRLAESYDWDGIAALLAALYRRVASAAPGRREPT